MRADFIAYPWVPYRYLGVGAAKMGLVAVAFLLITNALLDWDAKKRRKSRIEDPKVRAEMRRRWVFINVQSAP